jgi:hypothetical protein
MITFLFGMAQNICNFSKVEAHTSSTFCIYLTFFQKANKALIKICATNVKDILGKLYFFGLFHLNHAISNRNTCFEIKGVF